MHVSRFLSLLIIGSSLQLTATPPAPPAPPMGSWGDFVYFYTPATSATIQADTDAVYNGTGGISPHGGPNDKGQFVNQGYAFMFTPGSYTGLNIKIGYYTSILGLGNSPTNTTINSVNSPLENASLCDGTLKNYWRSAENFSTTPSAFVNAVNQGMTWAVSHGSSLRRMQINGALYLSQAGSDLTAGNAASTGAFLANSKMTTVSSGSQQQLLVRNSSIDTWDITSAQASGQAWGQTFVGCNGAPTTRCGNCTGDQVPGQESIIKLHSGATNSSNPCGFTQISESLRSYNTNCTRSVIGCLCRNTLSNCGDNTDEFACRGIPSTNIATTPVIAEKPFITYDTGQDKFFLASPNFTTDSQGTTSFTNPFNDTNFIDFSNVFVATPGSGALQAINDAIAAGFHIILTPGVYSLDGPIKVTRQTTPATIILGIGFPVLVSNTGQPCIEVGDIDGVRIGGIILQAGPFPTLNLLKWGTLEEGKKVISGFLYDCTARVGRFDPNSSVTNHAAVLFQINSSKIVLDNVWAWRADVDAFGLVMNQDNNCDTGSIIRGDNVIAYGLTCENMLTTLLEWFGNRGESYSFQGFFPRDAHEESSIVQLPYPFSSSGTISPRRLYALNNGLYPWTGYNIGKVSGHKAFGAGIYSRFNKPSFASDVKDIIVRSGITTEPGTDIKIINSFTRMLNQVGMIQAVINTNTGFNTYCSDNLNGDTCQDSNPCNPVEGFSGSAVIPSCPGPAYVCEWVGNEPRLPLNAAARTNTAARPAEAR